MLQQPNIKPSKKKVCKKLSSDPRFFACKFMLPCLESSPQCDSDLWIILLSTWRGQQTATETPKQRLN